MAKELILAIDQGTTNTKALLVNREGRTVFRTSAPLEILQPHPGHVEQDPIALWRSVVQVTHACVEYSRSNQSRISGIAITNQRETAVAWKRANADSPASGQPIGNAISWQCRRSAPICERLSAHAAMMRSITGLPLDPLVSATKWAWVFEQHPELRELARQDGLCFGTVDSWLLYNMTAGQLHATDFTNASRTMLLSLAKLDWDPEMLALLQLPSNVLPTARPSSGDFGKCVAIPDLAETPIVAMIGDSHAALVAHGCYDPGTVKATYGTGSSLMMVTGSLVKDGGNLARTIGWSTADAVKFALEGNIAMSGAAVQWVGEFLGLKDPIGEAAALATTVTDSAGLVLVPAMVGLGAPYWDTRARGLVCNIERPHTAAHLAHAAIDAIAFQVAEVLDAMEDAAHVQLPVLLADGGAASNDTLMQKQADLIGRPVHRSSQEDLSARGAALLAGLALGWWCGMEELSTLPNEVTVFEPRMNRTEREKHRNTWRIAVQRARLGAEIPA
jgi:glycerol kinase